MAFTTMHFAIGMAGTGAAASVGAFFLRRGWRWIPLLMTAGGVWACGPDLPRLFREDFPSAPFAQTLSAKPLQLWLQNNGDLFFFHRILDEQPKEYALHGLLGILLMYTLSCLLFALKHRKPENLLQQDQPASEATDTEDESHEDKRQAA